MDIHLPPFIKEHPVEVGGIAVVALVGIYILTHAGSASAATASSATNPAAVALAEQQQALQGQLAIQGLNVQAGAAHDALAFRLAEDTLGAQTSNSSQALAAQVALTKYTTDAQTALQTLGINTQYALAHDANVTLTTQEQIQANLQTSQTLAWAALQTHVTDANAAVAETQTAANVQIANINANEQIQIAKSKGGGGGGFLGSLLGTIALGFL